MKSSSGAHYVGLDHVRAIAALMVFVWHFTHAAYDYPVPFEGAPAIFPLALFDEGHTGVALFMVLSGYLFARLLDGRQIAYAPFFWNRFLRLAPLLLLVFAINVANQWRLGNPLSPYLLGLLEGLIFPRWPNGGWSIAIEMHFYIALPLLLFLTRKWKAAPIAIAGIALLVRIAIYLAGENIQDAAFWTIIGRADDFLFGIAAFQFRSHIAGRHALALAVTVCFSGFYWYFDRLGGYYEAGNYNPVWIVLPTIEAVSYSILVAYYDGSFRPAAVGFSGMLSKIGDYSYSIYLLHTFFVFRAASFVHEYIMDISKFYLALVWAVACFALMIPVGYISYTFLETPFLQHRRKYIRTGDAEPSQATF